MLCLTLTGKDTETCKRQYEQEIDYIQMVELRLDLLDEPRAEQADEIISLLEKPVILTCRREQDGGRWRGSEKARYQLLLSLLDSRISYIDLEEDCRRSDLEEQAAACGAHIIRSYHDINGMPENIFARAVKLRRRGDIAKIAVTPRNIEEVMMIFRAKKELADMPGKVIVGMGAWGIPTRILYRRTGSAFTFCSPEGDSAASGHLSAAKMAGLFRADRITDETRIFGIIGNPVMHTSSPMIHNPAFQRNELNAVYVPFQVGDVRSFFQLAEMLPIEGFSVTVPHKQHVLPYLGRISREVKLIGSCNTVVRRGNLWKGLNTDFYGFLKPIEKQIESGSIRRALVIGAGGAARSVVWALRNHGCRVTILNRTPEKAVQLAEQTGSEGGPLSDAPRHTGSDLIVQTTSAGMSPLEGVDPVPDMELSGREIVYDLVYAPKETLLLKRALAAGCSVVYGMEMLLAQGVLQFESFTGMAYPEEL